MTASISDTDRFSSVGIYFDAVADQCSSISAQTTGGVQVSISLSPESHPDPLDGTDAADDLAVLRAIWASTDGFRDADDNPVAPIVGSYKFGTTIQSLIDHGNWNPLDPNDYDRWLNRQQMIRHLSAGNNVDRALAAWVMNFGLRFGDVEVEGTVNQNLGEVINVRKVGTQAFEISLFYDVEDRVTYPNFHQQLKNKALLAWLESIRQGTPVVSSGFTDSASLYNGVSLRNYGDTEGSFDLDFSIIGLGTIRQYIGTDLFLTEVDFTCGLSVDITPALIADIRDLLGARDIEVTDGTTTFVKPPVDMPPFRMGSTEFFNLGSTVAIKVKGPLGEPYVIPLTGRFGATFPWDDLQGTGTERTFTRNRVIDTVHVGEVYNSRLILPPARELVQNNGEYRVIAVHNIGEDGDGYCQIQGGPDADGDYSSTEEFLRAYPHEELEFRIGLTRDGKEEVIALNPPVRHLQLDVNAPTFPELTDFTEFDWAQGGASNRIFLIHYSQTVNIDADAFDLGSGTPPTGTPDFETGVADWDIIGTVEILLDGVLNAAADFGLRLTASGSIGRWSGIRLYLIRGTTLIELDNVAYETLSGNNNSRFYRARRRYRVRKGDRIGVFFRDRGGSDTSIALNDVELEGGKLDMWLEPQLVRS